MEEDLRGYLDWITQAEDLDADPAISSANLACSGKDNGAGNIRNRKQSETNSSSRSRKTSKVIVGLIRSSIPLPMVVISEEGITSYLKT